MSSFDQTVFNTVSLANAALAYAQTGIPIFPLVPGTKRPLVRHGFYSATTNLSVIQRWWRRQPWANIGAVCGEPSGWWVLDVDPRHGGWQALELLHHDLHLEGSVALSLQSTRCQQTGGDGVHLIFRRPADLTVKLAPMPNVAGYQGIDFKGDRSYILVAPSVHPSGKRYQWLNDHPLAPFPEALVQRWMAGRKPSPAPSVRPPSKRVPGHQRLRANEPYCYLRYALARGIVGQRHRYALYLGCRLVEQVGLTWHQAVPWMLEYVSKVSQGGHPYTEREALSALAWAFQQRSATYSCNR